MWPVSAGRLVFLTVTVVFDSGCCLLGLLFSLFRIGLVFLVVFR
jgi:hypothetical protein